MLSRIKNTLNFIKHNKKIFNENWDNSEKIILVEFFDFKPSIIPYSYISNILAKKYNAKIVSYNTKFQNYKHFIKSFMSIPFVNNFNIFKSFNAKSVISPSKKASSNYKIDQIVSLIKKKLKKKDDILKIKIEKILIGDLIYDEYLRKYNLSTIDIKSEEFHNHLVDMLLLFFFWINYFNNHDVKSVVVSHSVYSMGIVPRIAISKNISAYNIGMSYCYNLNKKNYLRLSGFNEYPNILKKIKIKINKNFLEFSKKKILEKFNGVDPRQVMGNIQNPVFKKIKSIKKKNNPNKAILVASHCFTDAVHAYGKNIFADHFEWLKFIGELSNSLSYKFLIKLHPAQYDLNKNKMEYFLKRYPNFIFLKKNLSHNEIFNNYKILCALTVYGSIAHEYPLFNIPVINACINNSHGKYNFSYSPKTISAFKKLIINCEKLKVKKKMIFINFTT